MNYVVFHRACSSYQVEGDTLSPLQEVSMIIVASQKEMLLPSALSQEIITFLALLP